MPRPDQSPSPYVILGVSPEDDFSAIREAWRRLVKTYHPDVWYGSAAEATKRLMAVNDAYDRLSVLHNRVREEVRSAKSKQPASKAKPARRAERPRPETKSRHRAPGQEDRAPAMVRTGRPSAVAGRFDDARAMFSEKAEGRIQALA
ncbi:J domain-containing protein [Primorskyibacter sp. 2E233]|uniref:J domain-containing protein n=1 Tax=Primorskyibacter sp. 2E233 TaxID=3413431 RepID=UPI003BF23AA7